MTRRLDSILAEARTALSAADQEALADLIETYVATRATPLRFSADELAKLKRRHDAPFDPAPDSEVRAFFAHVRP